MNSGFLGTMRRFLRTFAGPPVGADAADAQLLQAFAAGRDQTAFKALVQKHGPMVLGVCRRVLGQEQDAEDAFQATFLVLARKAAAGFRPRVLAGWLYEVACRTARKALGQAARRRLKERQAARMPTVDADSDALWADVRPVLDDEIRRLPQKYRMPFVLCYLQGKTNEQAAELMGCPKGTILSRLASARERLRARLARRGLAPSAAFLAALGADRLSAAVPEALAELIAAGARAFAWGAPISPAAPDPVTTLAEGVLTTMSRTKLATAVAFVLLLGLLGTGVALASFYLQAGDPPQGQTPNPKTKAGDGDPFRQLLEKRRDAARMEFNELNKEFLDKQGSLAFAVNEVKLHGAAIRLLESELALAGDRAGRIAVCKAHRSRMQVIANVFRRRYEVGIQWMTRADVARAEYYVLDAEIRLEEASKR